jgi:hypothetical protein
MLFSVTTVPIANGEELQSKKGPVCNQAGCVAVATGSKGIKGSNGDKKTGDRIGLKNGNHGKTATRASGGAPADEERARAAARAREAEFKAKVATYQSALAKQQSCLTSGRRPVTTGNAAAFCPPPTLPNFGDPGFLVGVSTQTDPAKPGEPTVPRITLDPQQVAYMAFARLRLTPPTPGIGPSPKLNKWDMAAVGYPLWLWAEGLTDPAPVSDSVFNLAVSLDAHVAKVDFDMGDGQTVTCSGDGSKWTSAIKPGQESPTCGYTYSKPSLPDAEYTVTVRTHWAVDWSMNGATGTIPYVQASTTTLPVGELQVLVR